MSEQEFATKLGIETEGSLLNSIYSVKLKDSDEYSKYYTKLDSSDLVDLDSGTMIMSEHNNIMHYVGDEFVVTLKANFDADDYALDIERID